MRAFPDIYNTDAVHREGNGSRRVRHHLIRSCQPINEIALHKSERPDVLSVPGIDRVITAICEIQYMYPGCGIGIRSVDVGKKLVGIRNRIGILR